MLYADFKTYLPECLMAKIDIATMANSLEGRSPLLEH
ncbi:MAG: asparagine synthase-related protein, partial [Bacteroidota bacterium]